VRLVERPADRSASLAPVCRRTVRRPHFRTLRPPEHRRARAGPRDWGRPIHGSRASGRGTRGAGGGAGRHHGPHNGPVHDSHVRGGG
jgi:hypothetical protein